MKILSFVLLAFAELLSQQLVAQVSPGNIALTGVAIIDANHQTPALNQTVLISRNNILDIFTGNEKVTPDSFTIIPLKGKYLLPGLIDSHVHMATDPSGTDNRQHTLSVLEKMLFSGITSLRDMAGDARVLAGLARDAMTGDINSPNIYYAALMAGPSFFNDPRTMESTKGGVAGKMPYMLAVTDSTNMALAIAAAKGSGAKGIKLYRFLSAGVVNKIVAEAKKQGMPVWSHAWLDYAKPSDIVKAGAVSISHAPLMIYDKMDSIPSTWKKTVHTDKYWDNAIPDLSPLFSLMKASNTIFDATLLTYKKWGREDSSARYSFEIGKRIAAQAYKDGVKICAGTDDDQEEFVQKEMAVLVYDAGFTPIDAIIAATLHSAETMHIDNKCGSIVSGKAADFLILNKNPLENIENIESVYLVMKGGRIFKK